MRNLINNPICTLLSEKEYVEFKSHATLMKLNESEYARFTLLNYLRTSVENQNKLRIIQKSKHIKNFLMSNIAEKNNLKEIIQLPATKTEKTKGIFFW